MRLIASEDGSPLRVGVVGAIGRDGIAPPTRQLQRKVALKLIKFRASLRDSADAPANALCAKQPVADAALRHENIVTIQQSEMRLETGQYFYAELGNDRGRDPL